MKILIIGEFSSFSKNLSSGFRQLGHECFVFSWGDGFKKIRIDNSYLVRNAQVTGKNKILRRIKEYIHLYNERRKLVSYVKILSKKGKYDVALIINPDFICNRFFWLQPLFSRDMVLSLVNNVDNIYLSACGGDVPYYEYWSKKNAKNRGLVDLHRDMRLGKAQMRKFEYIGTFINKVIPVMYEYAEAWRKCDLVDKWKVLPTVPLPIDTTQIKFQNTFRDKILIYHGLIRPLDKGTQYIQTAMERIQKEYPSKVTCLIKGGMPLDEYKQVLEDSNVSIDQVYSFSTGMNGLYSLAMGKILLSGNMPENEKEFDYKPIPTFNICADENQIYTQLRYIVEHPEIIPGLSQSGRKYIEEVHEAKLVAQKYIDLFLQDGVNA